MQSLLIQQLFIIEKYNLRIQIPLFMNRQGAEPIDERHQIYFTQSDYERLYSKYNNERLEHKNDPYQLLLCAKACFFMGKYDECIKTINKVRIDQSTKILFERQCLLIKATYLDKENEANNLQNITKIYQEFEYYRMRCPGAKIQWYHLEDIDKLKQTAIKAYQLQRDNEYLELNKKQLLAKLKALKKVPALQGIPSYLVSKQWERDFNNYIHRDNDPHPGLITNFQLLNHIFEFNRQPNKIKAYTDTLMFPYREGTHYSVLNVSYWKQLDAAFQSFPVQRIYISDSRYKSIIYGDNLIKTLFQFKGNHFILQWQTGTFWERSVFPNLMRLLGKGQLKQQTRNKQYLIVQPGLISQPTTRLKYVLIDHQKIQATTPAEVARKDKIVMSYDLQEYGLVDSRSNGRVGLINLGNTCYMNSALQCLSHITQFSRFFLENGYLQKLNLQDSNKHGSYGQVTCALADILKRIWFCSEQTRYIDPTPFKRVFGQRFQLFEGNDQQDAQQFLMFLLNCIHDDLNEKSNIQINLRESTTNKKFDQVKNITLSHFQKHNKSIIASTFVGFHSENITCHECNSEVFKFEDFMMFHIQVPVDTPKLELYLVPYQKKSESATKIQVYLDMLSKYSELQQLLRDQLKISPDNNLYPYLVSSQFQITTQIKPDSDIKMIYNRTNLTKDSEYLFIYEIRNIYKEEEIALVTYTYSYREEDTADGFPRIMPIQSDLKQKQNKQKLKQFIIDSIPTAMFQLSQDKAIENYTIKNSKGTLYTVIVSVKTKQKLKMFKYNSNRQILGKKIRQQQISLQSCLNSMSEKQLIGIEEGWQCNKCKQLRPAYKTDKIYTTSQILLFDFKRFTQRGKITTKINYPVTKFDITPFLGSKVNKMLYNLVGVILHRGSLNYGHYTAYCLDQTTKKWYHYDDEYFREVDPEVLVDQNAYILMYQKQ